MKIKLYKGAYNAVSALSDLTGGASPVTKWKVALGVTIMGLSTGVMTGCEPQTTCYIQPQVTCYDMAVPPEETDPGQEGGSETETGTETGKDN